jgi:putative nucleotidyltransferase with HDIG domain
VESCTGLVEKINTLPTLSPILQKIKAVMGQPDSSAADIVDVLKLDPAISSKVLRLANSAYIGIPRTVSSLQNAVVILGQQRIYSLVLASSTLAAIPRGVELPFRSMDFWKHSITVAIVCESIARHLQRYDDMETGEFFCAGILHDIGKLALSVFDPERIVTARTHSEEKGVAFFEAEDEDMTHMQVGYLLAHRWNFPENLTNAILNHHTPERAIAFKKVVAIVHLADIMVHLIGLQTFPNEPVPVIRDFAISQIELQPERLRTIAYEACEDEKRIESLIAFVS